MFQTLAYFSTVFYRRFTSYTTQRLQALGLHFGSLFPVLYVGKQSSPPTWDWTGATPSASWPDWWRTAFSPGRNPVGPTVWS